MDRRDKRQNLWRGEGRGRDRKGEEGRRQRKEGKGGEGRERKGREGEGG